MTLTEFLLARIAEDEAVANAAHLGSMRGTAGPGFIRSRVAWASQAEGLRGYALIARFDPARVLAECEAKRRIVEQLERHVRLCQANAEAHAEASRGGLENQEQITTLRTHGWELSGRLEALRMAADALAAIYADHPDYRDEWRP